MTPNSKRPAPRPEEPAAHNDPDFINHATTTCASTQAAPVTVADDAEPSECVFRTQPESRLDAMAEQIVTPQLRAQYEAWAASWEPGLDARPPDDSEDAALVTWWNGRHPDTPPSLPLTKGRRDAIRSAQRAADEQGPGAPVLQDAQGRPQPDAADLDGYERGHIEAIGGVQ